MPENRMPGSNHRERKGWVKSRPVRVVFFVDPASADAQDILDAIFADSYGRWGGRFSLIVPCEAGLVMQSYWPWLEAFDPDIVYSYSRLEDNEVLRVHEQLVPADYVFHGTEENRGDRPANWRPQYDLVLLSSMSTIFRVARHSPVGTGPKVRIIDCWYTHTPSRFLTDNFGTYRGSASTSMFPNDARAAAGLLTIVSDDDFHDRKLAVPRDLDRVDNEDHALNEFTNLRAIGLSELSSLYCPRLQIQDQKWGNAFNLVVGESNEDRLLFWNARLLIPAWLDSSLCCFRVTVAQLEDPEFTMRLVEILNKRNRVSDAGGGQCKLMIRSASHDLATLKQVAEKLASKKLWSGCACEVVPCGHVVPDTKNLAWASVKLSPLQAIARDAESLLFRWSPPVAKPPVVVPEHLADAPPMQGFTMGRWAVDVRFGDDGDGPRFGGNNEWWLPKRWRMAEAFKVTFTDHGPIGNRYSHRRTCGEGTLCVFPSNSTALESIEVPTIDDAMQIALCRDFAIRQEPPSSPPWPTARFGWMRSSNEAQHLVGVLGLAGGLAHAQVLLLHPFMQELLGGLGGTPNLADSDANIPASTLLKRSRRQAVFNLADDSDREALTALVVKTAKSIKQPRAYVKLQDLRQDWEDYRMQYAQSNPRNVIGGKADAEKELGELERQALDSALTRLRSRRMLFQGLPWTCQECQHKNWVDFQALKEDLSCEVCGDETGLPVDIPWHFRANEFLIESLRSHSALSLVWTLTALADRAKRSFLYVKPTNFGALLDYKNPDAEADLLVVMDGKCVLCEVKAAWRSLRASDVTDLVAFGKRIRPDRVVLAIMEKGGKKLGKEIAAATAELAKVNIEFELLTLETYSPDGSPFHLG